VRPSQLSRGLAAVAALAAAGCGVTVVDSKRVEAYIAETVTDEAGVRVTSVVCPKDPKARMGATFTCEVTAADGTTGDAVGTQRDNRGGVAVSAPFLPTRRTEDSIADQIQQQTGATAKVRCPDIVTLKAGGTFHCMARDGTRTRKVRTTMTDNRGNVRFKLL
jgi:NAD(P)-dependent dehydrogenase (short-subunit alcohol dehydrogenase family)